ncbi:MAG: helix-turn-helix domain-containing protein [Luteolibacter sp.]
MNSKPLRDQKRGKASSTIRAVALLLSDEGPHGPALKDADIQAHTRISIRNLERLRLRCYEIGSLAALARKPRATPGCEVKITGEVQARITQLACTKPPAGQARWTLKLLAKHLVEIEVIESISHQSVGTVLKKANSSHGGSNAGASHPDKTPPS